MAIRVALRHVTEYHYDRMVALGPQVIRLRPAPHCRTKVVNYSLNVSPGQHFLNWQQDPHGNFLARVVISERTRDFVVAVDLTADLVVINPFDFFVEEYAEEFPFEYEPTLAKDLLPFLEQAETGKRFDDYFRGINFKRRRTIDFLVDLNQKLWRDISYVIRMEPGVQSPEETLEKSSGSCRDSALLLVQLLRRAGLAARFVSGYLVQLRADVKSLDGPSGPEADFTDLHAWCEAYLPGAGWVGLDPTSGLFTGEGHLPLAATPDPMTAAPISGCAEKCETEFHVTMTVTRIHEDPRVTLPYSDSQWEKIDRLGKLVDEQLFTHDVRLTMGGEPTFVSIDDMESPEWNIAAVGVHKQQLSGILIQRLRQRFAPGGLLHFGQGKWYPGESLPRWAYSCLWRRDEEPIWSNPDLLANPFTTGAIAVDQAGEFLCEVADRLEVDGRWIRPAYEDIWQTIKQERRLPPDVDPRQFDLDDDEDRRRLARVLEHGLSRPVGFVLPLTKAWWQARGQWVSGAWPFRTERLFLIPGDSPIGLRLPLDSLPVAGAAEARVLYAVDPFAERHPLPGYQEIRRRSRGLLGRETTPTAIVGQRRAAATEPTYREGRAVAVAVMDDVPPQTLAPITQIFTALCIEPRNGQLHVFMPPLGRLEDYVELVGVIEAVAEHLRMPVVMEGYLPPVDHRLQLLKVTPDPGVIEVNIQPARNWQELKDITHGIYEEAHFSRLATEKFQLDGRHTGTGGGNHVVLGGPSPADSPFIRRPDLLRSFVAYWINHPSLSYTFSSQFIGPTSQAPRVDEGRRDNLYELEIAFSQIPEQGYTPPWLVDRIFRNLLVDITGNTHRAEFCIDKLYSPDHANGRLGLVEFRAFEMPPHARMSLTQQLLMRALVALFWTKPYREKLTRWGTALHDQFMLPHFLGRDLADVARDLRQGGFDFEESWFAPHLEFRCPLVGTVIYDDIRLELRAAIEPWHVLGEEPGAGGTARFVDSSVERLQVLVTGMNGTRHAVTCNGRPLPLRPTDRSDQFVAGLRFRAWQPPHCLQPTIPVHTPLTFDLIDRWSQRSLGGCRYHVDHPGGINPSTYPVNALEAECRRGARFTPLAYTGGFFLPVSENPHPDYPFTLDLRMPSL